MNIYTTVTNKLNCSMYWGERTLIEENVPATLHWQPLQEAQGTFSLQPEFFDHSFWNQYRPDSEQKLFFTAVHKKRLRRIWVDEYDVRAYVRGWKNVPSFRLKRIEFVSKKDQNSRKIPWQKIESWFLIPGEMIHNQATELSNNRTIQFQPIEKSCILDKKLFSEFFDHLEVEIYIGKMDQLSLTLICLKNCESLQPETTSTYRSVFKTEYDMIAGLLMLSLKQNLTPVWQLVRDNKKRQEFCYYESEHPRRNLFTITNDFKRSNKSVVELHQKLSNKSLNDFTNCMDDIDAFTNLLTIENLLGRFEKAVELINRLIEWNASDLTRWPEALKSTLEKYHVEEIDRFVYEYPFDDEDIRDPWNQLVYPLQSLYPLVAGKSPKASWFNGKKMKERNEIIMNLLAELIIGNHFPS